MAFGQAAPPLVATKETPVGESRRREDRTRVIKGGKICFGQALVDCTILDVSPHGARVRTDVIVQLPEMVIVRFNGGSSYVARVQWARGTEIGFTFKQPEPLIDADAAAVALSAFKALPPDDLSVSLRALRSVRFFDDPALAKAAEDAEASYLRFKAILKERIRFPA